MTLHSYFRSTASWRVRTALNLKGIAHEHRYWHLRRGEHASHAFRAINPQGLLPALETGDGVLTQSLAICEYLDEVHPEPPLLRGDAFARARIRAVAQVVACDVHPVQNLKVLERLRVLGHNEPTVRDWAQTVIADGLDACARLLANPSGRFCFGGAPTLADVCLIPQLGNARRFGVELRWDRLNAIADACAALQAFADAAPTMQADAEP